MLLGNPKVKAMTDAKRATYSVSPGCLRITESFFSLEGEGVLIGCPTYLIRFASCNQRCTMCDTKFSSWWDTDAYQVSGTDLLRALTMEYPEAEWVSFTGGEPFYRSVGEEEGTFVWLAQKILALGRKLKVETSGTMVPPAGFPSRATFWSIAPKIPGGGMGGGTFLDPDVLQTILTEHARHGHIKFVVGAREKQNSVAIDFEGIKMLADQVPALRTAKHFSIIFQPEGLTESSVEYLLRCTVLAEAVLKDRDLMRLFPRWRVLPQWHQLLWRNERRR